MLGVNEDMVSMRLKANSRSTTSTTVADHLQHQLAAASALQSGLLGGGTQFALLQQQQLSAQLQHQHAAMIAAGAGAGTSFFGGAGPYSSLWPGVSLPPSFIGGGGSTISASTASGFVGAGLARRTSVPSRSGAPRP